ncbi:MAG: multidrug efflux MFS transporter [Blastochloris sp.]|nr:multidrug efflux MFS transporter [Blastochloris sp.]
MLAQLTPTTDGLDLMPWLIMRGIGFGLTFIPAQTKALERITAAELPKASSLFNVTRQIAASIGIAALVTLFVQRAAARTAELRASVGPDLTPEQLASAATLGMNDVFTVVTIGTAFILLLAFALPGRSRTAEASAGSETGQRPAVSMD